VTRRSFRVTGTNNTAKQASVDWTNDLAEITELGISVMPQDFGASPDATAAVNGAAFQAALDYLETNAVEPYGSGVPYSGGGTLFIPKGIYLLDRALDIKSSISVIGDGPAVYGAGGSTVLRWNDTSSGFRVQRINTSGDATYDAVSHGGGDGTIFKDLWLEGGSVATYQAGTETGDYHAIHFKGHIEAHGVYVRNWSGNGFHSHAVAGSGVGATEGNANVWQLVNCRAQNCRWGLYLDGADTNAGYSIGFNATCRQGGIFDGSFLANHHLAFHLDSNGFTEQTMATNGTNVYSVIPGQETWCSTNAPPAGATNNQGWLYHNAGVAGNYGSRTWTSGLTWRSGGPIFTDNANAHHVISGYVEGGQPPSMLTIPTVVLGGHLGSVKSYGTDDDYGGYLLASGSGLAAAGSFNVAGLLSIAGLAFNASGLWASGHRVFNDATNGLNLYGDGDTNDILLGNGAGTTVATVPNGTTNLNLVGNLLRGGTKILGAQGAAIADATDAPSAITQLNLALAALRTHGLIAT
jgi:hypothetical protein